MRVLRVTAALLISTAAEAQIPNSEPPSGTLPAGKRMLVDDGTCPAGEIKEVSGGSNRQNIARSSRCIPHRGGKK